MLLAEAKEDADAKTGAGTADKDAEEALSPGWRLPWLAAGAKNAFNAARALGDGPQAAPNKYERKSKLKTELGPPSIALAN